jgi:hypothetical protein
MKEPDIELHIEELVLHGFAQGDRFAIAEALHGELARLFADNQSAPVPRQSLDIARVDAGAFEVAPGSRAGAVGAQVARALHGGLTR